MVSSGAMIGRAVDLGVAGLFAVACGFPAMLLLPEFGATTLAVAGFCGLAGLALALWVFARLERAPGPAFAFKPLELPDFPQLPTLQLGPADRLAAAPPMPTEAELLDLEDVLAAVSSESRVVQLFGGGERSSAGELALRIESHIANRGAPAPVDASEDLFDALSALRRSLR